MLFKVFDVYSELVLITDDREIAYMAMDIYEGYVVIIQGE